MSKQDRESEIQEEDARLETLARNKMYLALLFFSASVICGYFFLTTFNIWVGMLTVIPTLAGVYEWNQMWDAIAELGKTPRNDFTMWDILVQRGKMLGKDFPWRALAFMLVTFSLIVIMTFVFWPGI